MSLALLAATHGHRAPIVSTGRANGTAHRPVAGSIDSPATLGLCRPLSAYGDVKETPSLLRINTVLRSEASRLSVLLRRAAQRAPLTLASIGGSGISARLRHTQLGSSIRTRAAFLENRLPRLQTIRRAGRPTLLVSRESRRVQCGEIVDGLSEALAVRRRAYTTQTRRGFVSASPAFNAASRLGITNPIERIQAVDRRAVTSSNVAILLNRGTLPRSLYKATYPSTNRTLIYFGTHRPEGRSSQNVDQA